MKKGTYLSDKDYNYIYSRCPRVCVDLIVKRGKKFFLIRRKIKPYKGTLHLPGGRILFRESISNAIQRIAKSEIGCRVGIIKLLGVMEFPREKQIGPRHSISLAFLVVPKSKLILSSLNENNIHPVHLKFLKSI